jgi:hypothetical protein
MCWSHEKYSINEIYFYLLPTPHMSSANIQTQTPLCYVAKKVTNFSRKTSQKTANQGEIDFHKVLLVI